MDLILEQFYRDSQALLEMQDKLDAMDESYHESKAVLDEIKQTLSSPVKREFVEDIDHAKNLEEFREFIRQFDEKTERIRELSSVLTGMQLLRLAVTGQEPDDCPSLGTFEQSADQSGVPGRRWLEPDEKRRAIEACRPTGHIDYMSITRAVAG